MSNYEWWRNGASIKVIKTKYSKGVMKKLFNACKIVEKCMRHRFDYTLFNKPYRLYRRGKNRCLQCGVKL